MEKMFCICKQYGNVDLREVSHALDLLKPKLYIFIQCLSTAPKISLNFICVADYSGFLTISCI